ncbi:hypothetical protein [Bosea sp. AS-1]|jgi:hypothetical protein|uniref:hypothetical protein n=1 Tax=Bosea sp. AS-1 TaxID=2015316 RepID=UPI000B795BAF|nr:hypothetical protein [Bosea sp. AS-1]
MTERPIKVGDTVRLSFGFADRSGEGDYEIIRVMPARESGERHYRVRGIDGRERAIGHDQIIVSKAKAKSPVPGSRG